MIYDKSKGVITGEYSEEDILDSCEILDMLSDRIVGIINATKSLFFLFRGLEEDFPSRSSQKSKREEERHKNTRHLRQLRKEAVSNAFF